LLSFNEKFPGNISQEFKGLGWVGTQEWGSLTFDMAAKSTKIKFQGL
jgi:hypothetical protein